METLNIKTTGSIINRRQVLIGVAVLLIGLLVYLVDRPPDQTYFVYNSSINVSLYNILPNLFGLIGNNLPAFIHVFSFILITAGLLSCGKKETHHHLLELAHRRLFLRVGPKIQHVILQNYPDWFEKIPFLEKSKNYFLQRTFDFFDLAAITPADLIGYFVLLVTMKKEQMT